MHSLILCPPTFLHCSRPSPCPPSLCPAITIAATSRPGGCKAALALAASSSGRRGRVGRGRVGPGSGVSGSWCWCLPPCLGPLLRQRLSGGGSRSCWWREGEGQGCRRSRGRGGWSLLWRAPQPCPLPMLRGEGVRGRGRRRRVKGWQGDTPVKLLVMLTGQWV